MTSPREGVHHNTCVEDAQLFPTFIDTAESLFQREIGKISAMATLKQFYELSNRRLLSLFH